MAGLTVAAATTATARDGIVPPVPAGWKIDASATGDLNGDGADDAVLILRKTDPKLIVHNDGLGTNELDTNPRRLAVFHRQGARFVLMVERANMLPPAGSTDSPCLADPLDDGGITIKHQVMTLTLKYWMSCGGWGTSTNTYKFRREGTRFRLIGFDSTEFMRNSGEGEEVSVNFLTLRKSQTPFVTDDSIPKRLRWSRIRPQRYYLDTLDLEACQQIDKATSLC